jgi:hypothetical protein
MKYIMKFSSFQLTENVNESTPHISTEEDKILLSVVQQRIGWLKARI